MYLGIVPSKTYGVPTLVLQTTVCRLNLEVTYRPQLRLPVIDLICDLVWPGRKKSEESGRRRAESSKINSIVDAKKKERPSWRPNKLNIIIFQHNTNVIASSSSSSQLSLSPTTHSLENTSTSR